MCNYRTTFAGWGKGAFRVLFFLQEWTMKGIKNTEAYRIAAGCVGVALLAILVCSCLSFNIGDWPSRFVHPNNDPARNWCGVFGAVFAYCLLYYIGPGVFIMLITGVYYLSAVLRRKMIEQMGLRIAGLVLVTMAASSSFYCMFPYRVFNFPIGSGGVLGVAMSEFLLARFAGLGTFILITAMWIVGMALLADRMLLMMFSGLGYSIAKVAGAKPVWSMAGERAEILSQIWRKLSAKQKTRRYRLLRHWRSRLRRSHHRRPQPLSLCRTQTTRCSRR